MIFIRGEKEGFTSTEISICDDAARKVDEYLQAIFGRNTETRVTYTATRCIVSYRIPDIDKTKFDYVGEGEIEIDFYNKRFRTDFGLLVVQPEKAEGYTAKFSDNQNYKLAELHVHSGPMNKPVALHLHIEGDINKVNRVIDNELAYIISLNNKTYENHKEDEVGSKKKE